MILNKMEDNPIQREIDTKLPIHIWLGKDDEITWMMTFGKTK